MVKLIDGKDGRGWLGANGKLYGSWEAASRSIYGDPAPDPMATRPRHQSVFVSYGGPDEAFARAINGFLTARGIKTWFFPNDALPGQKLHRVMHDNVNAHDRVLLICSKSSLSRPGVVNELERVLEREARQGGEDVLIPVTIDDFVFRDWQPSRPDIALQVRSRVIATIPPIGSDEKGFLSGMSRLEKALLK